MVVSSTLYVINEYVPEAPRENNKNPTPAEKNKGPTNEITGEPTDWKGEEKHRTFFAAAKYDLGDAPPSRICFSFTWARKRTETAPLWFVKLVPSTVEFALGGASGLTPSKLTSLPSFSPQP
jgi:hypothetical protein